MHRELILVGDPTLARRLERVEVADLEGYAAGWARVAPEDPVAVEALGGGLLAFTGVDSPITQAVGMGMSGPVSEEDLDRVEEFFFSRGAPAAVAVCPLADPQFVAALGRRGYRLDEFEDLLVARPGAAGDPGRGEGNVPLAEGMEVRRVSYGERRAWAEMAARGFSGESEVRREDLLTGLALFERPEVEVFGVAKGERLVAGAALSVQDGVGTLLGASTLPAYRGRGAQSALTRALLQEAERLGCDLVAAGGTPGSVSHRNQERAGLRVAYTKVMLVREPPA